MGDTVRQHYSERNTLPENHEVMLIGAGWNHLKKKAFLKFYSESDHKVYHWVDQTPHRPYCYTRPEFIPMLKAEMDKEPGKFSSSHEIKYDVVAHEPAQVIKIETTEPTDIGGTDKAIRTKFDCWEADIKYTECYMHDQDLNVGAYYRRQGQKIISVNKVVSPAIQEKMRKMLWDKVKNSPDRDYIMKWANLLNLPVPAYKRLAVDIEVEVIAEGQMPSVFEPEQTITAIGLWGSDGFRRVYVLDDPRKDDGTPLPDDAELCSTEQEMVLKAFEQMMRYPMLLSFNGDEFDFPYLANRAEFRLGIPKAAIPLNVPKKKKAEFVEASFFVNGVHIDLMRVFANKSLKNYAFNQKYKEDSLEAISQGLLKEGKEEYEGSLSALSIQKLASYCLRDAELTYKLSAYGSSVVMKLLTMICRIGHMPMDDASRHGVNQWIKGILYYEHRKRNELIPSYDELAQKGKASTVAIIKEKKYKGGEVVEPKPGVYFDVIVADFASLYPSILRNRNLSHETINCPHEGCKDNKIPETTHWVCKQRKGLTSLIIGSLRDLRVNYYKHLAKDKALSDEERQLNDAISQALKVIMNASYGVIGFAEFPLYCIPVADAVTAVGRFTIIGTIEHCAKINIVVIYGDTDSVFLKNPTTQQLEELQKWALEQFGVDLEIDKHYRWVVFSELKKNYVGIKIDGTEDIKGLTGKKSNTPPFIRKLFSACVAELKKVYNMQDFDVAKAEITKLVKAEAKRLENREIDLKEMIFKNNITKNPDHYGKPRKKHAKDKNKAEFHTLDSSGIVNDLVAIPQHIKAAKQLMATGKRVRAGDSVSFVKTLNDSVKPLQLAKKSDIDIDKYKEAMESSLDQLLEPLGLTFKEMAGEARQTGLDELGFSQAAASPNPPSVS